MLDAADVELGASYPRRVVDDAEAHAHVQRAWRVIEDNLSGGGQAEQQPFRPATLAPPGGAARGASAPAAAVTPSGATPRCASESSSQPGAERAAREAQQQQADAARQLMVDSLREQQALQQAAAKAATQQQAAQLAAQAGGLQAMELQQQQQQQQQQWEQEGSGSGSVMDSERAESSEEVVSNVVQDAAAPMPSACSALPPRSFKRGAQSQPAGRTVPTLSATGSQLRHFGGSSGQLGPPAASALGQQRTAAQQVPRLASVAGAAEDGTSDTSGELAPKRLKGSDSASQERACGVVPQPPAG